MVSDRMNSGYQVALNNGNPAHQARESAHWKRIIAQSKICKGQTAQSESKEAHPKRNPAHQVRERAHRKRIIA
ncbi:hypothetical protein Q75_12810, partial [Bacillus coahuilensis p1.1.43]